MPQHAHLHAFVEQMLDRPRNPSLWIRHQEFLGDYAHSVDQERWVRHREFLVDFASSIANRIADEVDDAILTQSDGLTLLEIGSLARNATLACSRLVCAELEEFGTCTCCTNEPGVVAKLVLVKGRG